MKGVVGLLVLALSACSFVGVKPPTPDRPRDCWPSNTTLPAADLVGAILGLGTSSFLFVVDDPGPHRVAAAVGGGVAAVTGAIYLASTIYGYRGVHAYQAAWSDASAAG